ncbi:MAG: hypothetical protein HGA85_01355 [Nanoarchaeota archaeon]|nr:hypothetical protein [Nanoarchaeota archaeon]
MAIDDALAVILAGGQGSRLYPLTWKRAKPSVPLAANYRLIDIPVSNAYNSGTIRSTRVITQFEPHSLTAHLTQNWTTKWGTGWRSNLMVLSAFQGLDSSWYSGTSNAVDQNLAHILNQGAKLINILAGDHVVMQNYDHMNAFHLKHGADMTIAYKPVPVEQARGTLGTLVSREQVKRAQKQVTDESDGIWCVNFMEKPLDPPETDGKAFGSMGIYTFNDDVLEFALEIDRKKTFGKKEDVQRDPRKYTTHDFGYDIIPELLYRGLKIAMYPFESERVAPDVTPGFWADLGKIKDYYEINLALTDIVPALNMRSEHWPIGSAYGLPVKSNMPKLSGLFGAGVVWDECEIINSVIGPGTTIGRGAHIENSILLGETYVAPGTTILNAIVDHKNKVTEDIGIDRAYDIERKFFVPEDFDKIVVVKKEYLS